MINDFNYALGSTLTREMIRTRLDPNVSERKLKSYKSFHKFRAGKHCWITLLNSPITAPLSLEQQQYKAPYATRRGLTEEGKVFKDILQRIIFPARF